MLIFLTSLAFGQQTAYPPLSDQNWKICITNSFSQEKDLTLNYRACLDDISATFLKGEILGATQAIFSFAEFHDLRRLECSNDLKLEIYEVGMKILNDKTRFSKYQNMGNLSAWGLYDPRPFQPSISTMILTNHGDRWNKVTIAHELSHYWFDRLCWNRLWEKSPEDFAMDFEKYYLK